MKRFLPILGLTFLVLMALDFVWLTSTGERLYRREMQGLMRSDVNFIAAGGFYGLYAIALSYLAISPSLANGRVAWPALSLRAGLLALAAFGTYDLTGLAVIRNWPVALSFIDMAWGTFAAVVTANTVALLLKMFRQI